MTRHSVTQLISLLGGLLLATAAPGFATDPTPATSRSPAHYASAAARPGPARTAAIHPTAHRRGSKAAFPAVDGHAVHDNAVSYFVLFDQLEWQAGDAPAAGIDSRGWVGQDRDRLWFRG